MRWGGLEEGVIHVEAKTGQMLGAGQLNTLPLFLFGTGRIPSGRELENCIELVVEKPKRSKICGYLLAEGKVKIYIIIPH